jgi:hypothetical protein
MEESSPVATTSDILSDIAARNSGVGEGSWCVITLAIIKEMCRVKVM